MASALSHPAVPLAIVFAAGRDAVPRRLAIFACVASVLPDVDALGYWAGVPYDAPLGHRGFTHSLVFAAILAASAAVLARRLGATRRAAFLVVLLAAASHGVLDALTTGGMGVAFFSPVLERAVLPAVARHRGLADRHRALLLGAGDSDPAFGAPLDLGAVRGPRGSRVRRPAESPDEP